MSQIPLDLFLACLTNGPQEIGLSLLESDRLGITIRDTYTGRLLLRLTDKATYSARVSIDTGYDTLASISGIAHRVQTGLTRVNMYLACIVNTWGDWDKYSQISNLARDLVTPIIVKIGPDVILPPMEFRGAVTSASRDVPYGDLATFEFEIESYEIIRYSE